MTRPPQTWATRSQRPRIAVGTCAHGPSAAVETGVIALQGSLVANGLTPGLSVAR